MAKRKAPEIEEPPRLIGYARVSTKEQRLDLQLDALRKVGVMEDNLHVEKLSAGAKKRPGLELAIMDVREGDTLVVWRLDRLARDMRDFYIRLDAIYAQGGKFRSLQEDFDFGTITGKFVLGVLALTAELERQIIASRTSAGIQSRKASGVKWGRRLKMTPELIAKAKRLIKRPGATTKSVAKRLRVSVTSLYVNKISRRRIAGKN